MITSLVAAALLAVSSPAPASIASPEPPPIPGRIVCAVVGQWPDLHRVCVFIPPCHKHGRHHCRRHHGGNR